MSGSGGDRGYDYQADVYAYVAAHGLAGQHLKWFEDTSDVPVTILMETGGAGDDLQIITSDGRSIELQAKHALKRGKDLFELIKKLVFALNKDTRLRAVIMVDRHASQTITEDLRQDIIRLGQGRDDDLKEITTATLADLKMNAAQVKGAFQRLRIVVVDLDEGNDGLTAACAMLGKVVDEKNSLSAYKLLGKRGHMLTKYRGRDELHNAAEELENAFGFRSDAKSSLVEVVRFRRWVGKTTDDFFSPALGKRFPINQAWSLVQTFEEESQSSDPHLSSRESLARDIARYQEWHRLAERTSDGHESEAVAFVRYNKCSVLLGGPGAGKSTLSKRLSNEFNSDGKLAIRVRLKSVAAMIRRGDTFDQALAAAAIDGWRVTSEDAQILLASLL